MSSVTYKNQPGIDQTKGNVPLAGTKHLFDPSVKPVAVVNAAALPFADESFASVLCDPPYNGSFQWNHDLLCELSRVAAKRIVFQHWFIPADCEGRWKKWHKFEMSQIYVWQPRTYFGRGQLISVFDSREDQHKEPLATSKQKAFSLLSLIEARNTQASPEFPDRQD